MKAAVRVSVVASVLALAACSSGGNGTGGGAGGGGGSTYVDGGILKGFTPPPSTAVNNAFLFTVTGEGAATGGNAFPPAAAGDPFFLDGWEIKYDRALVTFDKLTVSLNPDKSPTDQSQTGALVGELDGPWAVDLAKGGPMDSKEMNGTSVAIARLANQNKASGTPAFDSTSKYAFGFDLVAATLNSQNVNLDVDAQTAYQKMITAGQTLLLVGTATWKGAQSTPACRSTNAAYDFGRFPKAVKFSFGFKTPTTYKNCLNPELTGVDARGLQSKTGGEVVAQVTMHLDHPFWEALEEDAPLRWDALAARKTVATGIGSASADITEVDLQGVDFQALKDAQNTALPIRYCGPVDANEATTGTLKYDPKGVPVSPAGGAAGLKDLYEYMSWNQSTFGHLNNDGLCFPARNFPAP
jgi:hypothetical protein